MGRRPRSMPSWQEGSKNLNKVWSRREPSSVGWDLMTDSFTVRKQLQLCNYRKVFLPLFRWLCLHLDITLKIRLSPFFSLPCYLSSSNPSFYTLFLTSKILNLFIPTFLYNTKIENLLYRQWEQAE